LKVSNLIKTEMHFLSVLKAEKHKIKVPASEGVLFLYHHMVDGGRAREQQKEPFPRALSAVTLVYP
jgi:hypothetical protein